MTDVAHSKEETLIDKSPINYPMNKLILHVTSNMMVPSKGVTIPANQPTSAVNIPRSLFSKDQQSSPAPCLLLKCFHHIF